MLNWSFSVFTNGAALFQGFVDFVGFGAKSKDSRIMSSTISLSDRWLIQSDWNTYVFLDSDRKNKTKKSYCQGEFGFERRRIGPCRT